MTILVQEVNSKVRLEEPAPNDTISDEIDIDLLIRLSRKIIYYFRSKQECPMNRGNWIIDAYLKNGTIECLKYPPTMTKERFEEFIKPLRDKDVVK